MASTPRVRPVASRPKRSPEQKAYIAAVLTGIYASSGQAILHAQNHEYTLALKNAKKVAVDQSEEMMRGTS